MKIDDALKLTKEHLEGGMEVQLSPLVSSENIGAIVSILGIDHLNKEHLNSLINEANMYDCNVIVKNNVVIYQ